MNELLAVLEKYLQYAAMPLGERDYYDQRKICETRVRFGELLEEVVDKRVEEAIEAWEQIDKDSEY
jgi:hypothetical protein